MSSSRIPPLPSSPPEQQPTSFRSSVGSKHSPFVPIEGAAAAAAATPRVDLRMKQAICSGGGITTSGYFADVAGTLGSTWISRLRRSSPQPPPSQLAHAPPSICTAERSAGTQGSSIAGGTGASGVPGPAAQPSFTRPEPAAFLNSPYHVQRLCLSPLGIEDNHHRSAQQQPPRQLAAADSVRGFGPFRFSDVRDRRHDEAIKGSRPGMPSEPAPRHPSPQQPQLQLPQRTIQTPNPWSLAADAAEAGSVNPGPSGFFPLFSKMGRTGEEAQGAPKTYPLSAAEGCDVRPPVLRQRRLLAFHLEKEPISDRVTPHHSGQSRTPVFPLLPESSAGVSTVRLSSDGSTSRSAHLSRQSTERLTDLNRACASQNLTKAMFPAGGGRCRGFSAFGLSWVPGATARKACLSANPWHDNSALPGNAEDDSPGCQFLNKDATTIPINRKLLRSSSRTRLGPTAACGSEDRFSFWNMGRFWPAGAASESLSKKRLQAPDAAVSPLKCRKLGNQG